MAANSFLYLNTQKILLKLYGEKKHNSPLSLINYPFIERFPSMPFFMTEILCTIILWQIFCNFWIYLFTFCFPMSKFVNYNSGIITSIQHEALWMVTNIEKTLTLDIVLEFSDTKKINFIGMNHVNHGDNFLYDYKHV